VTSSRAEALFAGLALAIVVVICGYRYVWQSFRHTIPPDKLAIDIENAASKAATLDLVLEQYRADHLPGNYVRIVGEDSNEELREEWSHAMERDARDTTLAAYRTQLAELDTVTSGMAAPALTPARADSSRPRLALIESKLRALSGKP
jgi:hypothetical protein